MELTGHVLSQNPRTERVTESQAIRSPPTPLKYYAAVGFKRQMEQLFNQFVLPFNFPTPRRLVIYTRLYFLLRGNLLKKNSFSIVEKTAGRSRCWLGVPAPGPYKDQADCQEK